MRLFALAACAVLAAQGAVAQRGSFGQGDSSAVWKFFAERHDKNGDGKITLEEYARGKERFAGLDRDGDSLLTEADFSGGRTRRRGGRRRSASNPRTLGALVLQADSNDDASITGAEWKSFLGGIREDAAVDLKKYAARAQSGLALRSALDANKDGSVSKAELARAHAMLDIDRDGVVTKAERERSGPPQRGEVAPDFSLRYVGKVKAEEKGKAVLRLSSFRGKRPVALIFGSYT